MENNNKNRYMKRRFPLLLGLRVLVVISIGFILSFNIGCNLINRSFPDQSLVNEIVVLKDSISLLIEKLNKVDQSIKVEFPNVKSNVFDEDSQISEYDDSLEITSKEFFDYYYLLIKSIYLGKDWVDGNDNQLFYRVIISKIGEMGFVHIELIRIGPETDYLTLVSRKSLDPSKFNKSFFTNSIEFIEWISSSIIKIRFDKREHTIDLNDLFTIPAEIPL